MRRFEPNRAPSCLSGRAAVVSGIGIALLAYLTVPDAQAHSSEAGLEGTSEWALHGSPESARFLSPGSALGPVAELATALSSAKGTPDDPIELTWRALAALDYQTGEISDQLQSAVGKTVRIPGFTVPLEDFASSATEFLLVPYVGACVHTPPPPPNQLVYVVMDEGKRAKMDGWNPVWLEGVLHVENVSSVYGSSGYRVVGLSVEPYE